MIPKWYGIGWYRDTAGERKTIIIGDIAAEHRHEAEREVRRVCQSRGYIFEGVYPLADQRYQQRKANRQKPAQANLWWKQPEEEVTYQ
jgi:translation elongation factor EF-4